MNLASIISEADEEPYVGAHYGLHLCSSYRFDPGQIIYNSSDGKVYIYIDRGLEEIAREVER